MTNEFQNATRGSADMASTHEVLKAARDLIADPKRWTQGEFARNSNGQKVSAMAGDATCWCAVGAVHKVMGAGSVSSAVCSPAVSALRCDHTVNLFGVAYVNDRLGHEAILQVFDAAILKTSPAAQEGR